MKVLHISTYGKKGGAARSAYRLVTRLRESGIDAQLLVQDGTEDDLITMSYTSKYGKLIGLGRPTVDSFLTHILASTNGRGYYSGSFLKSDRSIRSIIRSFNPDLIHLHWITGGFLSISDLGKLNKPVVWTMHDAWPFTGGCHITDNCRRYTENCGSCPMLKSGRYDASYIQIMRKRAAYKKIPQLMAIAPSTWIAASAKQSTLLRKNRVIHIPNYIDKRVFSPFDKVASRKMLGVELYKKYILFAGMRLDTDKNKNASGLIESLQILKNKYGITAELLICGTIVNMKKFSSVPARYIGSFSDDIAMSLLYNCVDVVALPSLSENLSNTLAESVSCGTPAVCYNTGGNSDLISMKNGYLAKCFDVDDFAFGLSLWMTAKYNKVEPIISYDNVESEYRKAYDTI